MAADDVLRNCKLRYFGLFPILQLMFVCELVLVIWFLCYQTVSCKSNEARYYKLILTVVLGQRFFIMVEKVLKMAILATIRIRV